MSFFSFLENTFNKAVEVHDSIVDKIYHYENLHYNKTEEELLHLMKYGSNGAAEKTAARKILTDRGYNFNK